MPRESSPCGSTDATAARAMARLSAAATNASACTTTDAAAALAEKAAPAAGDLQPVRPPLCLVHALLAGELRRPDGRLVYASILPALKRSSRPMSLPLNWEEHQQGADGLVPGGPLQKVKLGPLTLLNQYEHFCRHFERAGRVSVHFRYDWRRSLDETAEALEAHLRAVMTAHGAAAQVVAHSMGCLVALALLHRAPHLFHSLLFAGGNFAGGAGFFPMNTHGRAYGMNKRMLGPAAVVTWPAMYQAASPMLDDPLLRDGDNRQLFRNMDARAWLERGEEKEVRIDWYDLTEWEARRLGPWRQKAVSAEMRSHVQICLKRGRDFQRSLRERTRDAAEYPPVAALAGRGFRHPDFFLWDGEKSGWMPWTEKLLSSVPKSRFVETDGTVSFVSASRPPGVPDCRVYEAKCNGPRMGAHKDLLHEVDYISEILDDLESESRLKTASRATANAAQQPASEAHSLSHGADNVTASRPSLADLRRVSKGSASHLSFLKLPASGTQEMSRNLISKLTLKLSAREQPR